MYAYFYIDKDDNLVECDRNTYKKWEFSLNATREPLFFYIKDRNICVECPDLELDGRLIDKYGDGLVVRESEFSVQEKHYTILTEICETYCVEDDDDSYRGFYGYYPAFSTIVICSSNGDFVGEAFKLTDCPNYGLEKAIEYHESIILDIVSGKDLKYIS